MLSTELYRLSVICGAAAVASPAAVSAFPAEPAYVLSCQSSSLGSSYSPHTWLQEFSKVSRHR